MFDGLKISNLPELGPGEESKLVEPELPVGMIEGVDTLANVPPLMGDITDGILSIGDTRPIIGAPPGPPFIEPFTISAKRNTQDTR